MEPFTQYCIIFIAVVNSVELCNKIYKHYKNKEKDSIIYNGKFRQDK